MMVMRVSSVLVALALVTMIIGCSSAPDNEMNASATALDNARQAEAENYAPILYQAAVDSLDAARVEIQSQDSKFALFRKYDRASALIASASDLAEKARVEAGAEKERVRVKNQAMVDTITASIASTKQAIDSAPKSKGSKADIEVMKADLATLETAFAAAVAQHNADSLLTAQSALGAIEAQLTRINGDLEAARQKMAPK